MVFYYRRSAPDRDFSPNAPQPGQKTRSVRARDLYNPAQGGLDMASRVLRQVSALAVAAAVAGLMAGTLAAQSAAGKSSSTTYKAPRTPDGKPDLQGNWSNNSVTPLQRPEAWKNKLTLNDQELADLKKLVAQVTEDGGDAQFGDQI